jgi:hypothetical protein
MGHRFPIFPHKEMFLKISTFLQNNLISVEIAKGTTIFSKYGELRFHFSHN